MTHALPSPRDPSQSIGRVEWESVRSYINAHWDPEKRPHMSAVGLTGSGKSYLLIKGILKPLCPHDRVLVVDAKDGRDELVSQVGKPVLELPRRTWYGGLGRRKDEPYINWYRLVLQGTPEKKRFQVGKALEKIYKEGDWIVYFDEYKYITGLRRPFLRLGSLVDEIYIMGRARRVSIVAGTQAPKDVTTSFYDQASFAWIGRIRDEMRQKRLREIGGMSTKELPYIANLEEHNWLLSADQGNYFAITKVTS